MAFTIRNLSFKAEEQLNEILKRHFYVNSKTKAIEKALEDCSDIDRYLEMIAELSQENKKLKNELAEIKRSLIILKEFAIQ